MAALKMMPRALHQRFRFARPLLALRETSGEASETNQRRSLSRITFGEAIDSPVVIRALHQRCLVKSLSPNSWLRSLLLYKKK